MATITSITSGNWSDAATWSGGAVPSPADAVTIAAGHKVTLDADFVCSGSISNNGTLSVNTGITLSLGTTVLTEYGTLALGGGSELTGGGTIVITNARLLSSASAAAWAKVTGGLVFKTASLRASDIIWQYVSMQNTGATELPCRTYLSSPLSPQMDLGNCVFNGMSALTIGVAGTNNPGGLSVQNCDFRNIKGYVYIHGQCAAGTRFVVQNNTFEDTGQVRIWPTGTSVVPERANNIMIGSSYHHGATQSVIAQGYNYHAQKNNSTTGAGIFYESHLGQATESAYIYVAPNTTNSHTTSGTTFRRCILDCDATHEANLIMPLSVQSADTYVDHVLHIGYGSTLSAPPGAVRMHVSNSTRVVPKGSGADYTYNMWMTEMGLQTPAEGHGTVKNCLMATLDAGTPERAMCSVSQYNVADAPLQDIWCDYNAKYNVDDFLRPDKFNNLSGGEHNITVNPQFADASRNFAAWSKYITGNSAATYLDGWAYLLAQNGYDAATKTQSATPTNADVQALFDWVWAGHTPQNATLATAGEGGTYIGAMPVSGEPVTELETNLTAHEQYMPGGTRENAASNTYPVAVPDGWTVTGLKRQGLYGTLSPKPDGAWTYSLTRAYKHSGAAVPGGTAVDADTPALELADADGNRGLLTVKVSIVDDEIAFGGASSLSGTDSASGSVSVNLGVNVPGALTWQDAEGTTRPLGQTANLGSHRVTVAGSADAGVNVSVTRVTADVAITGSATLLAVNSEGIAASRVVTYRLRSGGSTPEPGSDAGPLTFSPLSFG